MIHINVTCNGEGCRSAQDLRVDGLSEAFGDLLVSLRSLGWSVTGGPAQADVRCWCPEHREGFVMPADDVEAALGRGIARRMWLTKV